MLIILLNLQFTLPNSFYCDLHNYCSCTLLMLAEVSAAVAAILLKHQHFSAFIVSVHKIAWTACSTISSECHYNCLNHPSEYYQSLDSDCVCMCVCVFGRLFVNHLNTHKIIKCYSFLHLIIKPGSQYDTGAVSVMGKSIFFHQSNCIPDVNFFCNLIGWMLANTHDATLEIEIESIPASPQHSWRYAGASVILWTRLNSYLYTYINRSDSLRRAVSSYSNN